MRNELQVIISVLTADQPDEINETYLQRKLGLSTGDFARQYHSFHHLLKVGSIYCFQTLQAELDIVWQLTTDTIQKLFYSLKIIQGPENQKRRRYFQLTENYLPDFVNELRETLLDGVQDHFRRLVVQAQQEGLFRATLSPLTVAHQLLDHNVTTLYKSTEQGNTTYWLNEVVLDLWPVIQQFCTPLGQQYMTIALPPVPPQSSNRYSS